MNQHRALQRRKFVAAALGSAVLGSAWGSTYPDKPIKIVLPVSPGSAIDATARRLAPVLEGPLGQPLVIDNRPGSAGLIATSQLVRSPADGYTLAIVASTHCITPHLYKASFHPVQDVQPVVALTSGPMIFVVHASVPAKDIQQFVSYARSRPEKQSVPMGNSGNGTPPHSGREPPPHSNADSARERTPGLMIDVNENLSRWPFRYCFSGSCTRLSQGIIPSVVSQSQWLLSCL